MIEIEMRGTVKHFQRVAALTELHGRIDMLHLFVFGIEKTVGKDDTVETEGLQVRLVSEVTAISHACLPIRESLMDTLIHPIPDETAEHASVTVYLVPVVLQVAEGIAHAVSILTREHGPVVICALRYLQQSFPPGVLCPFLIRAFGDAGVEIIGLEARVEPADDIDTRRVGPSLCTFVMDKTRGIELMEPARHRCVVRSKATLIA